MKNLLTKEDKDRLSLLCASSNVMFYEYSNKGDYYFFKNTKEVLGYSDQHLKICFKEKGITALKELIYADDLEIYNNQFAKNQTSAQFQLRILCADKQHHTFSFRKKILHLNNGEILNIGCLWNIDNKYIDLKNIKTNLVRDEMTGLLNKTSTFSIVDKMLKEVLRDCECAFVFIDIDNFKQINDKYGHPFGDEVIIYVANLLKKFAGQDNVVGRFGGDEFIIFVPNVTSRDIVFNMIQNILNEIKNFKHDISETFAISLSIGITYEPCSVKSIDMFDHSDKALYTAKLLGKGQYAIYNKDNVINPLDTNIADLYEKKEFFKTVDKKLESDKSGKYFMASISVENMALFNKWYGPQRGLDYLNHLIKFLISLESKYKGIFGYLGSNEFALFLPNKPQILEELEKGCRAVANEIGNTVVFLPAIGVYQRKNNNTSANLMYYKCLEAQKSVFANFNNRLNIYSEEKSNTLENEIMMILKFKKALENDEIQIYFQPKVDIISKKIVGAETLIRWITADGKTVYPNEFLPILEKYAIMYLADLYCWEKLFKTLRNWIDEGIKPTPVSINVSRSDIVSIDVANSLEELTKKYNIDKSLIRVEITESVYTESNDIEIIEKTIHKLKKLGFLIFMDDFGSGYSSLSILKSLNFDALKIDMKFLAPTDNKSKGFHILESVVKLAHDIDLPVVVEGVETIEQEEYLKSINCRFAQGYLYYRPMPDNNYKNIIIDSNNISTTGIIGYWKKFRKRK